ncbi:hypothetical protein ABK040_004360 [Willaertia magna]
MFKIIISLLLLASYIYCDSWSQSNHDEYHSNRVQFDVHHNDWEINPLFPNGKTAVDASTLIFDTNDGRMLMIYDNNDYLPQLNTHYVAQLSATTGRILPVPVNIPTELQPYYYKTTSMNYETLSSLVDSQGNYFSIRSNFTNLNDGAVSNGFVLLKIETNNNWRVSTLSLDKSITIITGFALSEVDGIVIINAKNKVIGVNLKSLKVEWITPITVNDNTANSGNILLVNENGLNVVYVASVNSIYKLNAVTGVVLGKVNTPNTKGSPLKITYLGLSGWIVAEYDSGSYSVPGSLLVVNVNSGLTSSVALIQSGGQKFAYCDKNIIGKLVSQQQDTLLFKVVLPCVYLQDVEGNGNAISTPELSWNEYKGRNIGIGPTAAVSDDNSLIVVSTVYEYRIYDWIQGKLVKTIKDFNSAKKFFSGTNQKLYVCSVDQTWDAKDKSFCYTLNI